MVDYRLKCKLRQLASTYQTHMLDCPKWPVARDRKIQTAPRTNQIVGFVTVPLGKKIRIVIM